VLVEQRIYKRLILFLHCHIIVNVTKNDANR